MTMAQSNSMGAETDLLFKHFWCLWMCAFCPCCLSSLFLSYHFVSLPACLFVLPSPSILLVCVFLPLLSPRCPLPFLSWSLSPCSQLSLFSVINSLLSPSSSHYWLSLDFFPFSLSTVLTVSLYRSVPPSMRVLLCICMILEVWDSWTSLNFKASDSIKVKS